MNDEEFKKKLDRILETLYQIDREAREAVERERSQQKNQGTQAKKKSSPLERVIKKEQKNPPGITQNIDSIEQQSL
jgi:hypothetical protein